MENKNLPVTNPPTPPPMCLLIKVKGKILEVVLDSKDRQNIYEVLTKYKKIKVIDRDLKGGVLEDIFSNNKT